MSQEQRNLYDAATEIHSLKQEERQIAEGVCVQRNKLQLGQKEQASMGLGTAKAVNLQANAAVSDSSLCF